MSTAANYLLSICCAALLASVVKELAGSTALGRLVSYLTGIFVALTVMSLLLKVELPDAEKWMADFRYEGQSAAADGEAMARDAAGEIIKNRLEAYILDKAAACGADPAVSVALNEDGTPESVVLQGRFSDEAKAQIMHMLETELGLGKEAQHWIE